MNYAIPFGAGGAAAGGGLGGVLGQLGDVLSAPRRAAWNAVGGLFGVDPEDVPRTGAELVGNLTGLGPDGVLANVLGFGAEMATDPLSYLGGAIGGIGGALVGKTANRMNALKASLPGTARRVAALTELEGRLAQTIPQHAMTMGSNAESALLRAIEMGRHPKMYKRFDAGLAQAMRDRGLGAVIADPRVAPQALDATAAATGVAPQVAPARRVLGLLDATRAPEFTRVSGGKLFPNPDVPLPPIATFASAGVKSPREAAFLRMATRSARELPPGATMPTHAIDMPMDRGLGVLRADLADELASLRAASPSAVMATEGPIARFLYRNVGLPAEVPQVPPLSMFDPYWMRHLNLPSVPTG